jgi:hypothetical protein
MTSKPLSAAEVSKAADQFFPLYEVVSARMPDKATTEDALKVMETVCKLAHKLRKDKEDERFGFNPSTED